MEDLAGAAETVASFMRLLTTAGGFQLKFRITAGAGAVDPDGLEQREIYVECKGPDAPLLLEREGELLHALEHIAAKMLQLEPMDHDRVSFDTNGFKQRRAQGLRLIADRAVASVRQTQQPYRFEPMSSRERRMLHLLLKESTLQTASSGEGPRRCVVLYPEGYRIPVEQPGDAYGRVGPGSERSRSSGNARYADADRRPRR